MSPNNPDHNPVDYQIWSSASLDKSAQDVDDLRKRLIDVWIGIQQSVIYDAIKWHRRLHTCIQSIGHSEYSLWLVNQQKLW